MKCTAGVCRFLSGGRTGGSQSPSWPVSHILCVCVQVGSQRVELTLGELQEMATRQQQQIEAQQQMLVAKVTTVFIVAIRTSDCPSKRLSCPCRSSDCAT